MTLLLRGRILTPRRDLADGWVLVEGDRVAALGRGGRPPDVEVVGDADHIVAPGFVDLQVNGFAGHDAAAGADAMVEIAADLPRTGVTAFCPTLVSAPLERMVAAAGEARRVAGARGPGARVLGAHLEGPFLNQARAGAHDPALLLDPTLPLAGELAHARPRVVTLAPELPGAEAAIGELVSAGVVVSAGHSAATHEQARAGFAAGIRCATHLFNAMAPWHHREPGLAGAALNDPAVTACLIADGEHVHPAALELAVRRKGAAHTALTTDMIAAAGAEPGRYRIGDRDVSSDGVRATLADGTLAGAVRTMDQLVRTTAALPGVGLQQAVRMATATPAAVVGARRLGSIAPGQPADLVLLDAELGVRLTLVGGEVTYRA
jgi:N-acetylglucosamine-6-phosphate deacetylase